MANIFVVLFLLIQASYAQNIFEKSRTTDSKPCSKDVGSMFFKLRDEFEMIKKDVSDMNDALKALSERTLGLKKVISACNRGYTFVEDIGLLYKEVSPMTHADAIQHCKTDGARLLLVNSKEILAYFHNLTSDSKYDSSRGTQYWGFWIDGKYDNGNWLDGTNNILTNIYWDPAAPLQPYIGTCMTFSYLQHGLLMTNRGCTWPYSSFCQVVI